MKKQQSKFDTLLLAGGLGSRLLPLTATTPKCIVPILGRPLMDYWFELLETIEGRSNVWVNTHHLADIVRSYLSERRKLFPNLELKTFHEPELLGTAGTIRSVSSLSGGSRDLLVIHADNLSSFNLQEFWRLHTLRPSNALMTMMTFYTDDPGSCGIVELDDDCIVVKFHEKVEHPPGNLANAAVYFLSPEALEFIQSSTEANDFSIDIIPQMLGKIFSWTNRGYHRDIGTPLAYRIAQSEFSSFKREQL